MPLDFARLNRAESITTTDGSKNDVLLIRTESVERCLCCHKAGSLLYARMRDQVFHSPGEWKLFKCEGCDLCWLNPRPIAEDRDRLYEDYYTHAGTPSGQALLFYLQHLVDEGRLRGSDVIASRISDQTPKAERPGRSPRFSRLSEAAIASISSRAKKARELKRLRLMGIDYLRPGRVLDIGCGNGELLGTLIRLGWEGFGIESDGKAAQFAREQHDVVVFEGHLTPETLDGREFDLVVLSHVIEHSSDPGRLLSECRRVLRPGGQLTIVTPNVKSLGHSLFGRAWRGLEPPRHMYIFSPRSLVVLVGLAGLTIRSWNTSGRQMRNIWFASRAIQLRDMGESCEPSFADYMKAQVMGIVGTLAAQVFRESGEEIFVTAEK